VITLAKENPILWVLISIRIGEV